MTYEEARKKLIDKYGADVYFRCQDCCAWSHEDVIHQALMED